MKYIVTANDEGIVSLLDERRDGTTESYEPQEGCSVTVDIDTGEFTFSSLKFSREGLSFTGVVVLQSWGHCIRFCLRQAATQKERECIAERFVQKGYLEEIIELQVGWIRRFASPENWE